jgi:hypothetical protein
MLVISFVQRYILVTSEFLDQRKNALTNYLLIFWHVQIMWGVSFLGYGPIKEAHHKNKTKKNSIRTHKFPSLFLPPFSSQLINTTNNTYLVALINL